MRTLEDVYEKMPAVGEILDTFRAAGVHGSLVDAYDETTGVGFGEWDANSCEDANHDGREADPL